MNILYSTILKIAEDTFMDMPLTEHNYPQWVRHWFATAEALRQKMIDEGLAETADAIVDMVDEQKKYVNAALLD